MTSRNNSDAVRRSASSTPSRTARAWSTSSCGNARASCPISRALRSNSRTSFMAAQLIEVDDFVVSVHRATKMVHHLLAQLIQPFVHEVSGRMYETRAARHEFAFTCLAGAALGVVHSSCLLFVWQK